MMKRIQTKPTLAQQVYDAIVDEICEGALPAGAHLVQEQLAERLGVSRQPVQQAMALLKADGMVEDIGGRGLRVTPLDPELMRSHYEIRAALDALATRMAAERARDQPAAAEEIARRGREILRKGEAAVADGNLGAQVRHDMELHALLYEASGNPLLARTAGPHWRFLRRAMGEVLRHAELPKNIWQQHAEILEAVIAGDPDRAQDLVTDHDLNASEALRSVLAERLAAVAGE